MSAIGLQKRTPAARLDPGRPSRSACWPGAAGSRSCLPRRATAGPAVACVGIKYEAPEELRVALRLVPDRRRRQAGPDDPRLSPPGRQADRHGGKGHQERDVHALEDAPALPRPADDPVVVPRQSRRQSRRQSLAQSIIAEFERDGMTFASALDFCPELLVKEGILTRRAPTSAEQKDIEFGWDLAKEMGRLDVGQSVAVKEKAALAVEAIEGTDRCIERAGQLCRAGGWVAGQGGQAPAGHAVRRADHRRHDDRKPAQGRGQGPGDRGRQDHPARPARGRRPGRPLWPEHRRGQLTRLERAQAAGRQAGPASSAVLLGEARPGSRGRAKRASSPPVTARQPDRWRRSRDRRGQGRFRPRRCRAREVGARSRRPPARPSGRPTATVSYDDLGGDLQAQAVGVEHQVEVVRVVRIGAVHRAIELGAAAIELSGGPPGRARRDAHPLGQALGAHLRAGR